MFKILLVVISVYQVQACYLVISYVCGTNGVTYDNDCYLNSAKGGDPNLTKAYDGVCRNASSSDQACACGLVYEPVCGSDDETYGNACELGCKSKTTPGLEIAYEGECKNEVPTTNETACFCTEDYRPVCGTDGNTYGNKCGLDCQKLTNPDLEIDYEGECKKPICACTKEYLPLCGTDSNTYGNNCTFYCQKMTDPGLEVAYPGECRVSSTVQEACICTADVNPVCGSDGVTYSNPCRLECQKRINPDLKQVSVGECQQPEHNSLPCDCPSYKSFVCGSDGQTYDNMCVLQCHQSYESGLNKAGDGRCE